MKKIALFLLPVFVLMFRVTTFAYTAPDGNDYQNVYHVTTVGGTFDIYCDNYLVASEEEIESSVYKLLYPFNSANNTNYGLYQIRSIYQNYRPGYNYEYGQNRDGEIIYNICVSQNGGTPQTNGYMYCTQAELESAGIQLYSTNELALQNSIANNIDFEHLYYDPAIPTPIMTVSYTDDISSLPRIPISVNITNSTNELYAYVRMDTYIPSFIGIDTNGEYEVYSYDRMETSEIVPMQQLTISSALPASVLSQYISETWSNQITDYISNNPNRPTWNGISPNSDFVNSTLFNTRKLMYETTLRKIGCFYGNNHEISVQFFRIEDDKVWVGEVLTWTNQNGGYFSVSIPKYYVPYNPANGFEVTTLDRPSEDAEQDVSLPDNQYGTKTGTVININNGTLVPNYPDYPTVATYNLDNILVSTIDNAKHLGNFFTEVSGFCVATFAWIPNEIWQIIALGFALSIVVMFVKIL